MNISKKEHGITSFDNWYFHISYSNDDITMNMYSINVFMIIYRSILKTKVISW